MTVSPPARLDSWYSDTSKGKGEVWEAVSGPAAAVGSSNLLPPWSGREDPRANSMLPLGGSGSSSPLWRVLLATGVGVAGRLVGTAELFPAPAPTQSFVVTEWGAGCTNGSAAARGNCSAMVSGSSRLNVTAHDPRAHGSGDRSFRLFNLVRACMCSKTVVHSGCLLPACSLHAHLLCN